MIESELGQIPKNWDTVKLNDMIEIKYGKGYDHLENGDIPLYGSGGIMGYVNKVLYDKKSILIPRKGSLNNLLLLDKPFWCVDTMFYSTIKEPNSSCYTYYHLIQMDFNSMNVGSAVPSMTTSYLNDMRIIKPSQEVLLPFDNLVNKLLSVIEFQKKQNGLLLKFQNILLSKLATIEN
jgi:type I restriction enzyme S subunit